MSIFCINLYLRYNKSMKILENLIAGAIKQLFLFIALVPNIIWLFVFIELFLFAICKNTRLEIFVLQFPITLWVLVSKKDK